MSLLDAILLVTAIADEGADTYSEEYDNGTVTLALKTIDNFVTMVWGE